MAARLYRTSPPRSNHRAATRRRPGSNRCRRGPRRTYALSYDERQAWRSWSEAGLLDDLVAEPALTGYPALLAHVEPTLAAIRDAQARRYQLASRLQDPERYYLPRDLADAARD
jgi:hypothetical protein